MKSLSTKSIILERINSKHIELGWLKWLNEEKY